MSNSKIVLKDSAVEVLKEVTGVQEIVANPELSGDEETLTGIEVDGTKYSVPQGGSGGVAGSPYVLTLQDMRDIMVGAHLDVEATISLIQELGLNTTLTNQGEHIGICMSNNGSWSVDVCYQPFTFWYYDCSAEYQINILTNAFGVGNENNLITALRSKKADIESYIIDDVSDLPFLGVLLVNNEDWINVSYLPLEKLRSIFVKDNA